MAQAQRAEAQNDDQGEHTRSFSKKPPTLLYDNGHGTRVSRWEEGVSNLQIERSYLPKGETDQSKRVTEKLNVSPEEALGIIFGLQRGVEQAMEVKAAKSHSRG
jgi:hypothetical protein